MKILTSFCLAFSSYYGACAVEENSGSFLAAWWLVATLCIGLFAFFLFTTGIWEKLR